ncbi:DNA polymerase III subunit gamma/tau [Jannaschia sp. W003]|uniref:DNA polymerase III subunit gamma/tau n=1 Tax=Jannaschia sp. W003 TaxID=2867012 RepID=UPI0021A38046|nr:DNA polymerase III subunit gamma/tau [Jannaschia sp. W003]UWQ22740.1 DNA polymerase III subunit gamma/tau [Jannaschia sp. W003]
MSDTEYQVLARKYRPQTFADLVGQDAMVRTLRNAFERGRIAQAFILTGIRGTGKTTTARIIAKGLNCVGPDGSGGPTTDPCGVCEPCRAIAEGRHVDVLEMDAASHTGVGDIREIIDSVRYRAASARYKIYIIDEVHMLSTSAFNALLKTLEEPPEHVKFIFATTEIRKVPVTVLSRCQRFDLRRIEPETMIAHLSGVAEREGATVAADALALIARAAEGSVRDAMSLMDQAIVSGSGEADAASVRDMLGLADRGRVMDLFEMVMRGDAAGALNELSAQYSEGADPLAILRDMAEIAHWVSVVQITPEAADDPTVAPDERARGQAFAQALPMRALSRMWQMLLKALEEVAAAPSPMMAAEMAVIRLTHVADLPSPDELIRKLRDAPPTGGDAAAPRPAPTNGGGGGATARVRSGGGGAAAHALQPDPEAEASLARFGTFAQVVELIRANRDAKLLFDVETGVRLARYAPGRIEFEPAPGAPSDLAARLAGRLQGWTGARWGVSVVSEGGAPTAEEVRDAARLEAERAALDHPLTQAAMQAFPGAKLVEVRTREAMEADAAGEALEEVEGEWDPFADE